MASDSERACFDNTLVSSLPREDQVILHNISPIEASPWLLARIENYKQHIATLGSLYNTRATIHSLPPEILIEIFIESSSRFGIRLSHVCRYWRSVLNSTPRFWADTLAKENIYSWSAADEKLFCIALSRSRTFPLQIHAHTHFLDIWPIVSPRRARLTSLTLFGREHAQFAALQEVLSSGLPNLRILRAGCPYGTDSTLSLTLDSDALPCLRELDLAGCLFQEMSTVQSLEHLTVKGGANGVSNPARYGATLLAALRRCISLRSLSFINPESLEPDEEFDADAWSCVDLPSLRSFIASSHSALFTRRLLSHLSFPLTTSVELTVNAYVHHTLGDVMPSMWMQRFEKGPPLDRIYLNFPATRCYTVIRAFSGREQRLFASVNLTTPLVNIQNRLEGILGPFQGINIPISALTVHISETVSLSADHRWMRVLARHFPRIRRLELLPRTLAGVKWQFATDFLQTRGDQDPNAGLSSGLTLAWVFHLRSRRKKDEEAAREVNLLLSALEQSPRCARLELCSMLSSEYRSWHRSLADIPSNAARTRRLVAPVLARLSELVDELVIW